MTDRWNEALSSVTGQRAEQATAATVEWREHERRDATRRKAEEDDLRPLAEELMRVHAALDGRAWRHATVWGRWFRPQHTILVEVRELGERRFHPEDPPGPRQRYLWIEFFGRRGRDAGELISVAGWGAPDLCTERTFKHPLMVGLVHFRSIPPAEFTPDMALRAVAAWALDHDVQLAL
jgi:hypothetical protein